MKSDALAISLAYITGEENEEQIRANRPRRHPKVIDIFIEAAKQFKELTETTPELKEEFATYKQLYDHLKGPDSKFGKVLHRLFNLKSVGKLIESENRMRAIVFDKGLILV
ncbi:MAG TPA: hypothetical protein VIN59_01360 [Alphaproteobacteria bacterium]